MSYTLFFGVATPETAMNIAMKLPRGCLAMPTLWRGWFLTQKVKIKRAVGVMNQKMSGSNEDMCQGEVTGRGDTHDLGLPECR